MLRVEGVSAHLQQLDVDQLLRTRRSLHELLTQLRPLHLPLLLVGKLAGEEEEEEEEEEKHKEERGECDFASRFYILKLK